MVLNIYVSKKHKKNIEKIKHAKKTFSKKDSSFFTCYLIAFLVLFMQRKRIDTEQKWCYIWKSMNIWFASAIFVYKFCFAVAHIQFWV